VERARYLLNLKGFDTAEESNTAMPADFLMQQMEWREASAEAKRARDRAALERLRADISTERREMLRLLERALDVERNYDAGCSVVRKLRFLEKLDQEIEEALE
jgi:molecular chaperone HscB